jgi:hypothetical protein
MKSKKALDAALHYVARALESAAGCPHRAKFILAAGHGENPCTGGNGHVKYLLANWNPGRGGAPPPGRA